MFGFMVGGESLYYLSKALPRPFDVHVLLGGAIAQEHDGGHAGGHAARYYGLALFCGPLSVWWTHI